MNNYYVIAGILIVIIFLLFSSRSNYTTVDNPQSSQFSTYQILAYDAVNLGTPAAAFTWPVTATPPVILTSGTKLVLAQAAEFRWSREKVNYQLHLGGFTGADGVPYTAANTWGFRKELKIGGGGSLWYIVNASANDSTTLTTLGNPNIALTETIDQVTFDGITYAIPQFVTIKKSTVSAVLSCDTNADKTPQADDGTGGACKCKPGYYGTGYNLSDVTGPALAQAGCIICPIGTYCLGGSSSTPCGPDTVRVGVYKQTTGVQGATSSDACYNPCSSVNSTTTPGTTTSAGSCMCNAGNYSYGATNGVDCRACAAGSFKAASGNGPCTLCAAGTSQASTGQSSCTNCAAGTYQASTGQSSCTNCAGGTYSSAPAAGATAGPTSCTNCAGGTYSSAPAVGAAAGPTSCTNCAGSSFSVAGASSCTTCLAGSIPKSDLTGCQPCAAGTFAAAGSCTPCTTGKISGVGAGSCTTCPAGQTSDPMHTSCIVQATGAVLDSYAAWGNNTATITINYNESTATVIGSKTYVGGLTRSGYLYTWTVPVNRTYTFVLQGAIGAQGSGNAGPPGLAAKITVTATLAQGTAVYIGLGQPGNGSSTAGGGGGASLIYTTGSNFAIAGGGAGTADIGGLLRNTTSTFTSSTTLTGTVSTSSYATTKLYSGAGGLGGGGDALSDYAGGGGGGLVVTTSIGGTSGCGGIFTGYYQGTNSGASSVTIT